MIDPNYRGAGLGRKLVQTVLAHPNVCDVERVYLMTTHQQQFYEHIGFEQNSSTTLVLLNSALDENFKDDCKFTTSELTQLTVPST